MIKFFRKIRQKLLTENKFSKYLIYAIGEIILVVIGILIAIQVNNWNEKRKQLAHGQELMLELIEDVKNNVSMLNWASGNIEENISNQKIMYDIRDLQNLKSDSLSYFFSEANIDVKVLTNTYDKIKSQGLTRLSDNDSLNKKINRYFDLYVTSYNRRIDFYLKRQLERKQYLNQDNPVNFNYDKIKGFDKVDERENRESMIKFLNLRRTKFIIVQIEHDSQMQLSTLKYFKQESKDLLESIHKELSKSMHNLEPLPDLDSI